MHRSTYLALSSVSSNILCDRRQRQSCQQPAEGAARQCQRPLVFRGDLADDRKAETGARLALVQPPPALQRLLDLVRLQPRAVVLDLQQHPAAALNVAVTGARPLAVVDNLNFGNPEKPEVMWQFRESVEGISEACEALGIPVVGGNVSFYNETDGRDINPTPVVGLLGLADPMPANPPRLSRAEPGMEVWELGPPAGPNLAGSAVQRLLGDLAGNPTVPDPETARRVIDLTVALAHQAAPDGNVR